VRKPVLVLVGKEDTCTPPYFSEELARVIPGAELEILDGGHFLSLESPDLFHARVRDFLERH
jgi:aminoacrylate hydrolase